MRSTQRRRTSRSGQLARIAASLQRNADLVVEAIGDPAANLLGVRCAGVQHHVERMMDVIRATLLAQLRLELFPTPGLAPAHSTISMPSYATSMPMARKAAALRRILIENRIGVVDVDEHLARLSAAGDRATRSCRPRPAGADVPCRAPASPTSPGRCISSSVQKVPSTSTQSAALHCLPDDAASIAAQSGRIENAAPVCACLQATVRCCRRTTGEFAMRRVRRALAWQRHRLPAHALDALDRERLAFEVDAVPLDAAVMLEHIQAADCPSSGPRYTASVHQTGHGSRRSRSINSPVV